VRERLQKILARAGLASRRRAEAMVAGGRVRVNGRVARLGEGADPERDEILVDGRPLPSPPRRRVLALHKPRGYVTTLRDPWGRPTVADLLPPDGRLVPVGRLDRESEGLLLCTNDGAVVQAVAHPRGGVRKRYLVWVEGRAEPGHLAALVGGLELEDGPARALGARRVDPGRAVRGLELAPPPGGAADGDVVEVVMGEGRKREVRRLFAAAGLKVVRLVRVAVGSVTLTGLGPGRYRYLSEREVDSLLASREGEGARRRSEDGRAPAPAGGGRRSGGSRAEKEDDGPTPV
jgi:23S rRNA pseudouridine2605 synthase